MQMIGEDADGFYVKRVIPLGFPEGLSKRPYLFDQKAVVTSFGEVQGKEIQTAWGEVSSVDAHRIFRGRRRRLG